MREKTIRRMIAVLDGTGYQPNDQHRELVVLLKLNDTSHDRIAQSLGISRIALEYYYAQELDLGVEAVLAQCSSRMLWLSAQSLDLGVSLRATQAILQPRSKAWREPAVDAMAISGDISDLTLEQVEVAIERLERQRRTAAEAAQAAAGADQDQAQPE